MNREELEAMALATVSAELYYELADTISEAADEDLYKIIEFGGDYSKELAYQNEMEAR